MGKSHYKKSNGKNVFTDFKHHAKSWANSKRMRSRRTRQQFKLELRSDLKHTLTEEVTEE